MRRLFLLSLFVLGVLGVAFGVSAGNEILFQDDQIIIENLDPGYYNYSWLGDSYFPSDFSALTNATKRRSPLTHYGFLWGPDSSNFHMFLVSTEGYYLVQSKKNDQWQSPVISSTYSSYIKRGWDTNKIAITVSGENTYLYVNDVLLQSVTLKNQGNVRVGVTVSNPSSNTSVVGASFTDVLVWRAGHFVNIRSISPDPVYRGNPVTLTAETSPSASCNITVILPSGSTSGSAGLYSKSADSVGNVSWTWTVGGNTGTGTAKAIVVCTKSGETARAEKIFGITKK